MQYELHEIQSKVLVQLLFTPKAKFSELNRKREVSSDHFNFHIKRLVELDLIEKLLDGQYALTIKGKEFANKYDTENKVIERQAKVAVLIVAQKGKEEKVYLIQQRLKQPYYGFWGFVSGKIKWGEEVLEAARRELKEETGLEGKLSFAGVYHKIDHNSDGSNLLEDKFFFRVKATNLKGKLIETFEGGKNVWLTKKGIKKLPDLFPDVLTTIELTESPEINFYEKKFKVDKY